MGRHWRNNPLRNHQEEGLASYSSDERVSGPRREGGMPGLESLITVQRVERDETLTENTIRVPSWRGMNQVQDLQGYLLRKNSYRVVELLSLAYCHVPDCELYSA